MPMQLVPGSYVGKIVKHELGLAKSGNQQIVFTVKVTDEVDEQDPSQVTELDKEYTRTIYETISDNTAERVVKLLKTLGFEGDSFAQLDENECEAADFQDLAGKQVPLLCEENNYQGNQNERWRFNFPGLGGGEVRKASSEEIRKIDAKYGDLFAKVTTTKEETKDATPVKTKEKPKTTGKKDKVPF
jgi:hypothetical protein